MVSVKKSRIKSRKSKQSKQKQKRKQKISGGRCSRRPAITINQEQKIHNVAAFIILDETENDKCDKILLLKETSGYWGTPGGKIEYFTKNNERTNAFLQLEDKKETPLQAIKREMEEEMFNRKLAPGQYYFTDYVFDWTAVVNMQTFDVKNTRYFFIKTNQRLASKIQLSHEHTHHVFLPLFMLEKLNQQYEIHNVQHVHPHTKNETITLRRCFGDVLARNALFLDLKNFHYNN